MLEMGLLWYEPGGGMPFADRVDAAAERYLERFGVAPNICLVPISESVTSDRISVRPDRRMRPGHILVGLDREDAEAKTWKPVVRSSDEVGVILLGPNGEELNRLRPVRQKRVMQPKPKEVAPIARSQPTKSTRAPKVVAAPPEPPTAVKTAALPPRPKAEPPTAAVARISKPTSATPAKPPKTGSQIPMPLDPAPKTPKRSTAPAKPAPASDSPSARRKTTKEPAGTVASQLATPNRSRPTSPATPPKPPKAVETASGPRRKSASR